MSDESWREDVGKQVRILQFIVCAMLGGILFLGVFVLSIAPQVNRAAPSQPVTLTMIVAMLVGVGLIARFLFIQYITVKARREIAKGVYQPFGTLRLPASDMRNGQRSDAQCLLSVFHSKTIASAAMFEGWALFAVMAHLIDGGSISLALAILLTLGVGAHFPTRSRAIRWVERQMDAWELERQHAGDRSR
jgi:hypothetical protein